MTDYESSRSPTDELLQGTANFRREMYQASFSSVKEPSLAVTVLLLAWVGATAFQVTDAFATEAEDELVAIKSSLPFISLHDFLGHRPPRAYGERAKVIAAWETLKRLDSPKLTVAELKLLANHKDADIRALAVLAMVAKETPEVVPLCLRLKNDPAATIPAHYEPGGRTTGERQLYTSPQTVGSIATSVLNMVSYRRSLTLDGSTRVEPDDAEWWALRKDNQGWLAWHEFLYRRASQGTMPVPDAAKPDIQRFRTTVDALPAATRAWVLLYLADDVFMGNGFWQNDYATEKEMIQAVRGLGAAALIEFLRSGKRLGLREPFLDDARKGRRFIMTYAPQLFTAENAEALMQLKLYTAAADADPKIVRRAVVAAMKEYTGEYKGWERAEAMAALASLGDDSDRSSAVKWFFEEPNKAGGSTSQSIFIHELERRHPTQWSDVVRRIVAHPTFDQLQPMDVMNLAMMVGKFRGESLLRKYYRYEDEADITRHQLRKLFQVKSEPETVLQVPDTFLSEPVWKVELGELGSSFAISADGKLLAIGMATKGQGARILAADSGAEVHRIPSDGRQLSVVFTDKAQLLLCASDGQANSILVWSNEQGETTEHTLSANTLLIPGRTGERVAAVDTTSLAWLEFPSGETVWEQKWRARWVPLIAISSDACWMATNDGWSKEISLIDTTTGQHRFTLAGHASTPSKLCFSNDGKRLVSTGEDNRVFIWHVSEGTPVARYRGNNVRHGPVALTIDAQTFFATAGHGVLAAYDVAGGRPQYGIKFNGNWIHAAVPSLDGTYLYLMIQQIDPVLLSSRGSTSRIECWKLP
ncbi:MAG TPA: hypothetical protein P5307_00315 [Pirellulaceae bacterium]|nr:hypothetical protein [Planctomycetaceae bacterium]HRX77468.1 hypothetical protein [Pirellulaceae bacterium]